MKYILKYFLLDLAEYYNKAIAKSARNPLTSLLPASLPPTTSKTFNCCCAFASLKR